MAIDRTITIPMPSLDHDGKRAQLVLSTYKGSGQVFSSASVQFVERGYITFELYGDYRKVVRREHVARVTQKVIDAVHAVFTAEAIETFKADAIAFYADKRAKEQEQTASSSVHASVTEMMDETGCDYITAAIAHNID